MMTSMLVRLVPGVGADDSEVMQQTKYKTAAIIRRYTRLDSIKQHNAAKKLGL